MGGISDRRVHKELHLAPKEDTRMQTRVLRSNGDEIRNDEV